jgi:hypothetical protein
VRRAGASDARPRSTTGVAQAAGAYVLAIVGLRLIHVRLGDVLNELRASRNRSSWRFLVGHRRPGRLATRCVRKSIRPL